MLHTIACSMLSTACRLHVARICSRSVNSPNGNISVFIGVDSGITVVDPGITGVDALHAGCNAGRRRFEKYAVNVQANSRRIFLGVLFYF
jgi:hypothetical protein